jgi:predicted O-linked N-acetylglucosamine transferase (SPINDLY family)
LFAEPLSAASPPPLVDRTPERRLRVGYVSADFRTHPVGCYVEPLLAGHDRARFEVSCYANVARPDAVTRRLQGLADHWVSLLGIPDAAAAERIRQDRIDILVDLAGHTSGNRLLVFARRPAPVQVTYIGYPGTTGMPAIAYRISDANGDPPGLTEKYYTEETIRLPEVAWCYQPPDAPEVGDLPLARTGHVTFGSFNNLAKVTPEVIAVWSRILRALPGAHLHLLTGAGQRADGRLREQLTREGIDAERVTLFPRQSRDKYLKLYTAVDVCLDPFPYHGCTTTLDALWMGVPVVTLAGKAYVQRQAVVSLAHLGLHELIADDPDAYVEAALRLANDRFRLNELWANLRPRMRDSTLTNPARFVPSLEDAYRTMWKRWLTSAER